MPSPRAVLRTLDDNLEKVVLVTAFSVCATIVAVEVFRRFVFSVQAPWSTYIPAYMFLWLTWVGAAYGAKVRAHLAFNEVRDRMPRAWRYAFMQLDNALYLLFAALAIYWSYDLAALFFMLGSIVPGTDNLPSWWFYSATPVGWALLVYRVLQNIVEDFRCFRSGEPLPARGTLGHAD